MTRTIDALGAYTGMFRQSAGAQAGFASTLSTSFGLLEGDVGRPGKLMNLDFGVGQIAAVATYGFRNRTIFSLQEDTRAPGANTNAIAANFWQAAADNVLSTYPGTAPGGAQETLQQYCMRFVQTLIDNGYTWAGIRIKREASGGLSNDAPIMTATDAANSVTFDRRVIPLMEALAAANGLTLYFIWNAAGGPEATNNDILLAFPGWDMVDAISSDVYANTAVSGVWTAHQAAFPRWVYSDIAAPTIAGATSITRTGFQISPATGDLLTIGAGTVNAENVTCTGGSGATVNVSAMTNPHAVGETILRRSYPIGAKVQHYGQTYISLVANNTDFPSPFPQGSTSSWAYYPYKPLDGTAGTPGVDCMTIAERQTCLDAWAACFNLKVHGAIPAGGTARWYLDKWYQFALTGAVPAGEALDSRVASQTPRRLDMHLSEAGVMGYPSWNAQSQTGGDAFGWVQALVSYCVAKRIADGRPIHFGWWDHDNGTIPSGSADNTKKGFTSVYSTFESRKNVYAGAPAAYFPLSGRVLQGGLSSQAQLVARTGRYGQPINTGGVATGTTPSIAGLGNTALGTAPLGA